MGGAEKKSQEEECEEEQKRRRRRAERWEDYGSRQDGDSHRQGGLQNARMRISSISRKYSMRIIDFPRKIANIAIFRSLRLFQGEAQLFSFWKVVKRYFLDSL